MDSTSLASQFNGLAVGGGTPNQRLRNKRSQRFTVPVQQQQQQSSPAPPHPAGSPPFSNSDESASIAGSGGSMVSDAQNLSQQGNMQHTNSNGSGNHDLFPSSSTLNGLAAFPTNFAQTNTGTAGPPSFLQQDPFAFVGNGNASARQRTLSAGSAGATQSHQQPPQLQHQAWGMPNSGYGNGATSPFNAFQSPFNAVNNPLQNLFPQSSSPYGMPEQQLPPHHFQQQQQQQSQSGPDDVIPTAIVVKNIPFNFPSTSLLQIIEELTLSPPYAFNYHYDNGTFRGLAFANFHTPQETDACVAALNGFEISGRKLRVEYKKVLQAGEKERIERDKAIKRMRSMQLERERLVNHQQQQHQQQMPQHHMQQQQHLQQQQHQQQHAYGHIGMNGMQQQQQQQHEEYEDYGHQIHPGNSSSFFAANNGNAQVASPPLSHASHASHGLSAGPGSVAASTEAQFMQNGNSGRGQVQQQQQQQQPQSSSGTSGSSLPYELDMNDPVTLELYSRVLLFKDDALRDELAFSRSLTSIQRRIVHLVAKRLGLEHRSLGTGDERLVVVVKPPSSNGDAGGEHRSLRTRASAHHLMPSSQDPYSSMMGGIGGGGAGGQRDAGSGMLGAGLGGIGNSLAASATLRKKSMPDLRHQQTHPNPSMINTSNLSGLNGFSSAGGAFGGANAMSPPLPSAGSGGSNGSSGVATRHSNHDLRRPRSAFYGAADFSIPPVPALPSTLPSAINGNTSSSSPRLANRHSMLFNQQQQSQLDLGDSELTNKAVGSPVNGAGAVRQPRGPDGSSSWARVASVAVNGSS